MAKRILITGAGRRLGKMLAEHYLAEGWEVVAHFNSSCELGYHTGLLTLQADLADPESVAVLCQSLQEVGEFDALIHNASCFIPDKSAGNLAEHFEKHWRVHVSSPAQITSSLNSLWAEGSAMICISDIYADIPNERFSAYCSAKAGLQNWSLSMAQRLAGRVRVNVIQPGPIQFLPQHDEKYRQMVLSQSLTGKELGYEAVVQACDYLLAAEAVTGTVMRVDGGRFISNRYDQTFS